MLIIAPIKLCPCTVTYRNPLVRQDQIPCQENVSRRRDITLRENIWMSNTKLAFLAWTTATQQISMSDIDQIMFYIYYMIYILQSTHHQLLPWTALVGETKSTSNSQKTKKTKRTKRTKKTKKTKRTQIHVDQSDQNRRK